MPEQLEGQVYYVPTNRGYEETIKQTLRKWRDMKEKGRTSTKRVDVDKD